MSGWKTWAGAVAVILALGAAMPALGGSQPSVGVVSYNIDDQISEARDALRLARNTLSQATRKSESLLRQADKTTDLKKKLALLQEAADILKTSVTLKRQIEALEDSLEKLSVRRDALLTAQRLAEEQRAQSVAKETVVTYATAVAGEADASEEKWPDYESDRQVVTAALLTLKQDSDLWRSASDATELLLAIKSVEGQFRSITSVVDHIQFIKILEAYPPDQVVDAEIWADLELEKMGVNAITGLVEKSVGMAIDEYFEDHPTEGIVNAALVKSLVDTAFTVATAEPGSSPYGFAVDKGLEIIDEYLEFRAEKDDVLSEVVGGAKLYAKLQEIGVIDQQEIVGFMSVNRTSANGMMTSAEAFSVDTGRKITLVNTLLQLKSEQQMGKSQTATRQSLADLIKNFEDTPVSVLDRVTGRTLDYGDFTQGVAFELGVKGWAAP